MRSLKVRVWCNENQKYFYPDKDFYTIPVIDQPLALSNGGMSVDFEIELCTGLADKKGVDIYDGDILTYSEDTEDGTNTFFGKVIWNSDYGAWDIKFNQLLNGTDPLSDYKDDAKIVGDVHQNQDLLG